MNQHTSHSNPRTVVGLVAFVAFLLSTALAVAAPMPKPPRATAPAPSEAKAGSRAKPVAATPTGVININKATAPELQKLPGVGEAKAKRIVAWRKQHGPFERIKDLRRVKGFGKKTVAKLAPYLRLSGATTLARSK